MAEKKVCVLQVLASLNVGGAESRVMDIVRNLGNTRISYDFLLHSKGDTADAFEEEAKALGCHIYRVPRFYFLNWFSYKKAMKEFFESHPEIDIVQGHMTSTASIYLPIAKKSGVKSTIAHARSAGVDPGFKGQLTRLLRKNLFKKTDYMWTCSKEAAVSVFGKENADKSTFIPNAIDVDKFVNLQNKVDYCENKEFSDSHLTKLIADYALEGKFVVGHIGRFHVAKNHIFLLNVFKEIRKLKNNAILMLVGDGELRAEIESEIEKLGLKESVILTGQQSNVERFYSLFDVLVFPSLYEGLPGTIVESQAAAVPALVSENVTKDVAVTDYVKYLELEKSYEEWAKATLSFYEENYKSRSANFEKRYADTAKRLKDNGFDVKSEPAILEKYYLEMLNQK